MDSPPTRRPAGPLGPATGDPRPSPGLPRRPEARPRAGHREGADGRDADRDVAPPGPAPDAVVDLDAPLDRLWHKLRSGLEGLDERDAARRLQVQGPNALPARGRVSWPRALARQLVHPLALLLWAAAVLALVAATPVLAVAIVVVVLLNAGLAFWQEQHAEHAVAALEAYLPARARALRGGVARELPAAEIVAGDVVLLTESAAVRPTVVSSPGPSRST